MIGPVYHGSSGDFDSFSYDFLGKQGTTEGAGFYFTNSRKIALGYKSEGGKLFEAFLDIKKPLSDTSHKMTRVQTRKFIDAFDRYTRSQDEDGSGYLDNWGDISYEGRAKILNEATKAEYDGSDDDVSMIHSIYNAAGSGSPEGIYRLLNRMYGYDSIVVENPTWGKDIEKQTIYLAWFPEQIHIMKKNPNQGHTMKLFSSFSGLCSSSKLDSKRILPMKEYAIWGIPPGKKEEDLLYTRATSRADAERVCEILRDQHGCKKCRIQVLDLSKEMDFGKAFGKTVRKNPRHANDWRSGKQRPRTTYQNLDEMIQSRSFEMFESDRLGNALFISDPDRAQRCCEAAEEGGDGSTHAERLIDMLEFLRMERRDNLISERLYQKIEREIAAVEKWHDRNGTLHQVIG